MKGYVEGDNRKYAAKIVMKHAQKWKCNTSGRKETRGIASLTLGTQKIGG
jgi:hypothetical protein